MIGEAETVSGLEAIRSLVGGWEPQPTSFEITTALALAHFASSRCQVMVIEAGLGGRLDATNIVTPAVSVLTPIDLDHQQHLGSSLAQIAAEKAGIIKPGVPVVSARQPDEAAAVIRRIAFERRAPLHEVGEPVEHLAIGLAGSYQRWNAALAIRALEHSGLDVPPDAIQRGLASVTWPGRFQRIGERIVLDGAHNPAAARCLAQTWREVFGETKATLVLGVLQDKNLRGICETLLPIASRIIAVAVQNPRSSSARELCDVIRDIAPEFPITEATSLPGAIGSARAQSDPILVAGSLFLVGETLAFLHDEGAREVSVQ